MKIVCKVLGHKLEYPELTCAHCHEPWSQVKGVKRTFDDYCAEHGSWFLNFKAPYCRVRIRMTRAINNLFLRRTINLSFMAFQFAAIPVGWPLAVLLYKIGLNPEYKGVKGESNSNR